MTGTNYDHMIMDIGEQYTVFNVRTEGEMVFIGCGQKDNWLGHANFVEVVISKIDMSIAVRPRITGTFADKDIVKDYFNQVSIAQQIIGMIG